MMDTDTRIALVVDGAITAREQQCRALHRYRLDLVDPPANPLAQQQAGVDDRMEHDAGGIGFVGILRDLPSVAETVEQAGEIGLVAHGSRPAERSLDGA